MVNGSNALNNINPISTMSLPCSRYRQSREKNKERKIKKNKEKI